MNNLYPNYVLENRFGDYKHGRTTNGNKYIQQTKLLQFTIFTATEMLSRNGLIIIEHPSCAPWSSDATDIWNIPQIMHLTTMLQTNLQHIHQCAFAATITQTRTQTVTYRYTYAETHTDTHTH